MCPWALPVVFDQIGPKGSLWSPNHMIAFLLSATRKQKKTPLKKRKTKNLPKIKPSFISRNEMKRRYGIKIATQMDASPGVNYCPDSFQTST
jgi:hypothetical protein